MKTNVLYIKWLLPFSIILRAYLYLTKILAKYDRCFLHPCFLSRICSHLKIPYWSKGVFNDMIKYYHFVKVSISVTIMIKGNFSHCTSPITAKNTVISPNFLVWKFSGKAQFPYSSANRPKLCRNCFSTIFVICNCSECNWLCIVLVSLCRY